MKNKNAFTLIELLVVVLIIGVLAAVALPQYTSTVEKSRSAEILTLANAFRNSLDRYMMEHSITPNNPEACPQNLDDYDINYNFDKLYPEYWGSGGSGVDGIYLAKYYQFRISGYCGAEIRRTNENLQDTSQSGGNYYYAIVVHPSSQSSTGNPSISCSYGNEKGYGKDWCQIIGFKN